MATRRAHPAAADEPALVARLPLAARLEHGALALAFTALVLSGLPLRFPESATLQALHGLLGGVHGARLVHRAAAMVMGLAGLAHLVRVGLVLARSRFDVRAAWTMLPTARDARDLGRTALWHLGRRPLPPPGDRHHLPEKIHYLAVLWGLPLMALSGLVLGFPVALGRVLPDVAIGMAMIAHEDEALAAIGVVVVWHLYHVHVAPGRHHRFLTWIDGRITRSQWRSEHPLEVERLTGTPVPEAERRRLLDPS